MAAVIAASLFSSKSALIESLLKTKKPGAAAFVPSTDWETLAICCWV